MKTLAIIVTAIATILFFISSSALTNDAVAHSSKDGVQLFNFFFWYTIPIILWVIYFVTTSKK